MYKDSGLLQICDSPFFFFISRLRETEEELDREHGKSAWDKFWRLVCGEDVISAGMCHICSGGVCNFNSF